MAADAEAASAVTAMHRQEAEVRGDVMTVAEAVWRHEMLKQRRLETVRCSGDAAGSSNEGRCRGEDEGRER